MQNRKTEEVTYSWNVERRGKQAEGSTDYPPHGSIRDAPGRKDGTRTRPLGKHKCQVGYDQRTERKRSGLRVGCAKHEGQTEDRKDDREDADSLGKTESHDGAGEERDTRIPRRPPHDVRLFWLGLEDD